MNQIYNGFETDSAAESEHYDQVYTQEESLQPQRTESTDNFADAMSSNDSNHEEQPAGGYVASVLSFLGERYTVNKDSYVPTSVAPRLARVEETLTKLSERAHLADYVKTVDVSLEMRVVKPTNEYIESSIRPVVENRVNATRTLVEDRVVKPASEYYSVGRKVVDEKVNQTIEAARELPVVKAAIPYVEKARTVVTEVTAPLEDEPEESEQENAGVISHSARVGSRVTNRLRKRAFNKLSEFKLVERAEKLHHISLIDYAKHNIDSGRSYAWDMFESRVKTPMCEAAAHAKESAVNAKDSVKSHAKSLYAEKAEPLTSYYAEKAGVLFTSVQETVTARVDSARNRTSGYILSAKDSAHATYEKIASSETVKSLISRTAPYLETVQTRAAPHLDSICTRSAPYIEAAQSRLAPYVESAKSFSFVEYASPLLERFPVAREYTASAASYVSGRLQRVGLMSDEVATPEPESVTPQAA